MVKNNQKGSTLLLTVIAMMLLSVLGTAILSMTTMNVSMKQTDKALKGVHYYAESGIEQAYTMTAQVVEQCISDTKSQTVQYIQIVLDKIALVKSQYVNTSGMIDMTKVQEYDEDLTEEQDKLEPIISNFMNADLSIKQDELQECIQKVFKDNFMATWNSQLSNLEEKLNDKDYYEFMNPTVIKVKEVNEEGLAFSQFQILTTSHTKNILRVTSNYQKNGIEQTVSAHLTIELPELENLVAISKEEEMENTIWKYGLVSQKDIEVNGIAEVIGNVFAYGTRAGDATDLKKFGGLVVNDNGDARIIGDVISHSLVQVTGNGQLTVEDSNLYCNSLVIQEESNGASITVKNSFVYTEDDIEHNGKESDLMIEGVYIGFSDGSSNSTSEDESDIEEVAHDRSSSIVINSPDIEWSAVKGSTLKITGKLSEANKVLQGGFTSKKYNQYFGGAKEQGEEDISILVPGVVTVFSADRAQSYQTGESVSIKGNYFAYTYPLDKQDEEKTEELAEDNSAEDEIENTQIMIDGLPFIPESLLDGTEAKDHHINQFYKEYYSKDSDQYMPFYIGEKGLNIELGNYWYTLGSKLGYRMNRTAENLDEKVWDIEIAARKSNPLDVRKIIHEVEKDYRYLLNRLVYRDFDVASAKENEYKVNYPINEAKPIENYIDFNKVALSPLKGDDTILWYSKENIDITSELDGYTGIIISEKNITIKDSMTFNGSIIAKGDIEIESGKTVNIFNTKEIQSKLTDLVNQNTTFKNYFKNSSYYTEQVSVAIEDVLEINYKQLVGLDNWQQITLEEGP